MITEFFQSEIGIAVYATLATTLVAFISGVAAAVRDNTFTWQAIDAFIRSHIMGRVMPIAVLLFAGHVVPGEASAVLVVSGLASVAAYVTSTIASVAANWAQGQTKDVPEE